MYDRILLPTDGSETAERAIEHALVLAERFDATLHALSVADSTSLSLGPLKTGDSLERATRSLQEAAEEAVSRVGDEARSAGVDVVEETRSGVTHDAIDAYIREEEIDLVVMATHGRTGLNRALLGSVTERVVRTAPVPVLTVGPDDETETET